MGRLGCRESTSLFEQQTVLNIPRFPVPGTQISEQPNELSTAQSSVSSTVTQVPSFTTFSSSLVQRVKSEFDCRVHPHLPDVSGHCLAEKKGSRNPELRMHVCVQSHNH